MLATLDGSRELAVELCRVRVPAFDDPVKCRPHRYSGGRSELEPTPHQVVRHTRVETHALPEFLNDGSLSMEHQIGRLRETVDVIGGDPEELGNVCFIQDPEVPPASEIEPTLRPGRSDTR